jgi:hypothetical protein
MATGNEINAFSIGTLLAVDLSNGIEPDTAIELVVAEFAILLDSIIMNHIMPVDITTDWIPQSVIERAPYEIADVRRYFLISIENVLSWLESTYGLNINAVMEYIVQRIDAVIIEYATKLKLM